MWPKLIRFSKHTCWPSFGFVCAYKKRETNIKTWNSQVISDMRLEKYKEINKKNGQVGFEVWKTNYIIQQYMNSLLAQAFFILLFSFFIFFLFEIKDGWPFLAYWKEDYFSHKGKSCERWTSWSINLKMNITPFFYSEAKFVFSLVYLE